MTLKKFAVIDFGDSLDAILDTFANLINRIDYFVSDDRAEIFGKSTISLAHLKSVADKENLQIVVADETRRQNISGNIISINKFLIDNLQNNLIYLKPKSVRLESSTLCQLNCTGCYMRKENFGTMGEGYLDFDNFKKFINENDFVKRIELSNSGEVFLNPDLQKILNLCAEKKNPIDYQQWMQF